MIRLHKKWLIIAGIVIVTVVVGLSVFRKKNPEARADITSPSQAGDLFQKANDLAQNHELLKAKEIYQEILLEHADFQDVELVQERLEEVNLDLIFSNTMIDAKTIVHEVRKGDTLGKLAKKYSTTVDLIRKSNNLKSNMIRVGQKLRIWEGKFNIFVDKSQNILILKDEDQVIKVYDVSTGMNNSTPAGRFKITTKLVDPVWFTGGAVIPPESPKNVLGSRWLGFDIQGYGIHGTTEPESIGKQVTAGCVRMLNKDVEEVYAIVPEATLVVVVD